MSIHVILTGSAGYLGARVRTALQGKGVEVTSIDLHDPDSPVDLRVPGSLENLEISGGYKLLHLAFPLPGKLSSRDFDQMITEINRNITNELYPVETLLISSTAIYGLDHKPSKDSEVNPWEIYGRLKLKSETIFRNQFKNLTIFRPGTLMEANRKGPMMRFINLLQNGPVYFVPGNGDLVHPFTHTDDLVDAITNWTLRKNPGYSEYVLTAAEPLSFNSLVAMTKKRNRISIPFPKSLLRILGSDLFPIAGISRWHFSALTYDFRYSKIGYPGSKLRNYHELFREILTGSRIS
jgi:nucleoside-diphosphate-sugar epimerase